MIDKEEKKKTLPSGARSWCVFKDVWNTALKIGTEHVGLSSSFFLGSWKVEGKKRWTKKKVWTAAAAGVSMCNCTRFWRQKN